MTKQIEPQVIDFTHVRTPAEDNYQEALTAIRGGQARIRPYVPGVRLPRVSPLADLSTINPLVLEHVRSIAQRLRDQLGYMSQLVKMTEAFHKYLGDDPHAVLAEVWHEAFAKEAQVTAKKVEGHDVDRKTSWTLDELWDTDFPDLQFLVDGLIPEGLALLVAAPKVGKSYFLATLIVCLLWEVAPFGKESLKARGTDVLLITPDDPSARRLKKRILSIAEDLGLKREDRKYDLFIEEEWALIEDNGAENLDAWLRDHPGCKAVFIDTLDRLRGGGTGTNWMKADERAMAALKTIADVHGITVVGTHHDRKNKDSEDTLDAVSGGRKITGGVDAILMLTRSRNSPYARLQLIGRDVEDADYHAAFDYPVWTLGDKVTDGDTTPKQRTRKDEVLDVLAMSTGAMTAEAVYQEAKKAGSTMSAENVKATLSRLRGDCVVIRESNVDGRKGGYRMAK